MNQSLKYDYDSHFDILYVAISDKSNSYGDEDNDDIMLMRNIKTDAVTGFTIWNFKKKANQASLNEFVKSFGVDLKKDILPYLKLN